MRSSLLVALSLTLACASTGPHPTGADSASGPDTPKQAASSIHAQAVASHIRFLADDLLGGRDPGTPGYEVAARYVAAQLQAMGIRPAGAGGSYFQRVELVRGTPTGGSLEVTGGTGAPVAFEQGQNVLFLTDLDQGQTDVSGELVFVGHGLQVPEYGYDDFAGIDVRGKIVVVLYGAPRTDRRDFFPSLASAVHGQSERVARGLRRRGAKAALLVWTPKREGQISFKRYAEHWGFDAMRLAESSPLLPRALVSTPAFDALLRQAGRTETTASLEQASEQGKPRSFSLGLQARLRLESKLRRITADNVVGVWPADPASPTKDELVLYNAHLDHMGVGKPVNGDSIYNGASDDAAGVASVLETARAFTRLGPLRRAVAFLFVTAEERGLLGSEYFARHPTFPLKNVVADIDVDGGYPIHPLKDVVALGTDESSLAGNVTWAAGQLGLLVSPDPQPDQAYFVRSDNYSFVKRGVPAAQVFNGEAGLTAEQVAAERAFWARRYHQPQDGYEADRDWEPFAQLTRFNFLLGVSVAQAQTRPTWNAGSWFLHFPEPPVQGEVD